MDDPNAPATKSDIALILAAIEGVKSDIDNFKVEVNTRFEQFEHRMEQQVLESEGRVITSTYRLAESMQQRIKQNEGNQAAFNARLATLEERLLEVEKRLNMPPAA
jgi:hypothetical protein